MNISLPKNTHLRKFCDFSQVWLGAKDIQKGCSNFSNTVAAKRTLYLTRPHKVDKVKNIQKTSLKIILGDNFIEYPAALEMTGLEELSLRRQKRCLAFAKSSLKYPVGQVLFPVNIDNG